MQASLNQSILPGHRRRPALGAALLFATAAAIAGIQTVTDHNANGQPGFRFHNVPRPARGDAATTAKFALVNGEADGNGGGLEQLHDGKVPTEADEPERNFFFAAGTTGGRIFVDLNHVREVKQVNTYSWHPASRGPQVYKLYASDGTANEFSIRPKPGDELAKAGWKLVAKVDTRSQGGGQHGVGIADPDGLIGKYRYLLFDISRTEAEDGFGNTFYSEIDVITLSDSAESADAVVAAPFRIPSADGGCEIAIDTADEPELKAWAEQKLAPVLAEWYPKITALLPGDGFVAPKQFSVIIRPGRGVAATGGTRITVNSTWLQRELDGEAVGALVHEVVHVIQQYGSGRRNRSDAKRIPGWLVEGIADYIRFFKFEPQNHGADLIWLKSHRNQTLNHDGSYRISANFLDYVVEHYDPDKTLIARVNAAGRQGQYTDELWQELTGKSLAELNAAWKAAVQKQLAAKAESQLNVRPAEARIAGWQRPLRAQPAAPSGWSRTPAARARSGLKAKARGRKTRSLIDNHPPAGHIARVMKVLIPAIPLPEKSTAARANQDATSYFRVVIR